MRLLSGEHTDLCAGEKIKILLVKPGIALGDHIQPPLGIADIAGCLRKKHGGRPELITMSSLEFLRRWWLLMPPPNKNLVRYYGARAI